MSDEKLLPSKAMIEQFNIRWRVKCQLIENDKVLDEDVLWTNTREAANIGFSLLKCLLKGEAVEVCLKEHKKRVGVSKS